MNKKREPAHPTPPHPPWVGKDTKNKSTPTSGRKGGRIKTNTVISLTAPLVNTLEELSFRKNSSEDLYKYEHHQ